MTDDDEFNTRKEVVQTERGYSLEISHQRGTDVRDQDEVAITWHFDQRPMQQAVSDAVNDVTEAMGDLRNANRPRD
jgi:hypothetical protein